ncbi:uncharacterized [Tachysurus ichikawai]
MTAAVNDITSVLLGEKTPLLRTDEQPRAKKRAAACRHGSISVQVCSARNTQNRYAAPAYGVWSSVIKEHEARASLLLPPKRYRLKIRKIPPPAPSCPKADQQRHKNTRRLFRQKRAAKMRM